MFSTLAVAVALAGAPQSPTEIGGSWEGAVTVAGRPVGVVLRIDASAAEPVAALDIPSQGANDLAVQGLTLDGGVLRFAIPAIGAQYEGRLDGETVTGALSQGGQTMPLILTRASADAARAAPNRPQTPAPPFPYRAEEVRIETPTPGVTLAGTLTLPQGDGPFPAALLITGSGQQDRDETLFDHKPFLVIADALTRRGVAVLRLDDRGVGGSTGDASNATTADFATDAGAAVAWLAGREGVDAGRIGLIGHSEGGTIAPLVAEAADIDFIVLIAGPAVRGADLLTTQARRIQQASGLPSAMVEANTAIQRRLMEAIAAHPDDPEAAVAAVREAATGLPPPVVQQAEQLARRNWGRWFIAHDPAGSLSAYRGPMLALYGGNDVQVDATENGTALTGVRPDAEIAVFPELNHLMQTATTGLPNEFATIEETFDPEALQRLVDWVVARAAP